MVATESERLPYQPALDGLRCAAITAVVLFHGGIPFTQGGYMGVDVFFVLSGYLITTLLLRERRSTGRIALGAFWARRARRLLPSLLVVCLGVTVMMLVDHHVDTRMETLTGVVTTLTYTSAWFEAFGWNLGYMVPTWSLSVEEWFYALFPLGFVLAVRRFSARWVYVAAGLAAAYYLVAADVLRWSGERIYDAPDTRAYQLLAGCALAVLLDRWKDALRSRTKQILAGMATTVLVLWVVLEPAWDGFYVRGGGLVVVACSSVVVWYLVTLPQGWLSRLLSDRRAVWIGRRSYTIYLINFPILATFAFAGTYLAFLLTVVLSLVYAGFSYRWIESPFLAKRSTLPTSSP